MIARQAGRVRRADWATLAPAESAGETAVAEAAAVVAAQALAAAQTEADALRAAARAEADALRAEAREQGMGRGLAEGRAAVAEVLAEARAALEEAWAVHRQIVSDALPETVDLALALARRVLFRELQASPEEVVVLARQLIEGVPGGRIRLVADPVDAAYLEGRRAELGETVEVRSDALLQPGDLIVETGAGTIEATLRSRIDRVEAAAREVGARVV